MRMLNQSCGWQMNLDNPRERAIIDVTHAVERYVAESLGYLIEETLHNVAFVGQGRVFCQIDGLVFAVSPQSESFVCLVEFKPNVRSASDAFRATEVHSKPDKVSAFF